jgi:hypothetical protein
MRILKGRIVIAFFLIVWPTVAWPQTPGGPQSAQQAPRNLSQDDQFLTLLRTRDAQFALIVEMKKIVAYHDNFRSRLARVLDGARVQTLDREQVKNRIDSELARLEKLENDANAIDDLNAKINLVSRFDADFPLRIRARVRGSAPFSPRALEIDEQPLFTQRERAYAIEVFQNVSTENREWLSTYEKLFTDVEAKLGALSISVPSLDRLPLSFAELVGAAALDVLTKEQIQRAISSYRNVLQAALREVEAAPNPPSLESVKAHLMADVDQMGKSLAAKSVEINSQIRDLEKNITMQAKALYGTKVGADSFTYLLIVFAGVFLVVMIMPRFYPDAVAINVLKSEFLLQFSTVFVLIAAIIILAIGELIAKDQLPVLLAGISGYVLGQLGKTGA